MESSFPFFLSKKTPAIVFEKSAISYVVQTSSSEGGQAIQPIHPGRWIRPWWRKVKRKDDQGEQRTSGQPSVKREGIRGRKNKAKRAGGRRGGAVKRRRRSSAPESPKGIRFARCQPSATNRMQRDPPVIRNAFLGNTGNYSFAARSLPAIATEPSSSVALFSSPFLSPLPPRPSLSSLRSSLLEDASPDHCLPPIGSSPPLLTPLILFWGYSVSVVSMFRVCLHL